MKLTIYRDSVCMADDMSDNKLSIDFNESLNFNDLFNELLSRKYLPSIYGNDVVWVMMFNQQELIAYKTKENKIYPHYNESLPISFWINKSKEYKISFKYFSSPLKRAEAIFKAYEGKYFHIYRCDYGDEYFEYKIPNEITKKWEMELDK